MHCTAAFLLACMVSQPGDPERFHIAPYLQWPELDAMTVMWETTQPSRGEVRYGTSPELDLRVVESDARAVHEVRLTGLLPRTRYFYQVTSGDSKGDLASFRTPPLPGEPWRLVVYGDSRSFPERHQRVAELAARFEPDLIVHTGDQVTRGTQRPMWKSQFFDPAAALFAQVPIVTALGNHEENAGNYYEYLALPGNERYFGLDFGDLHLVILDSNSWGTSARDSDQFAWLQTDLAARRKTKWTAVAFHHPLFSAHDKRAINPARWDWCPAFEELGVDVVLTGHDHFYYRSWPIGRVGDRPRRGIPHITTAGGGAPLYRMKTRSYTAVERPVHHVSVLDFDGDIIRGQVVDVDGVVIDQYELNKKPTPPDTFCSYEVYELEHSIRRAIENRPPLVVDANEKAVMVRDELQVPHGFRVPISARVSWSDSQSAHADGVPLKLLPGQSLAIPIAREVSLDWFSPTSKQGDADRIAAMRIQFLDERFRNREIEFSPIKVWRDLIVRAKSLSEPPTLDQVLDRFVEREPMALVQSDGSRLARVPAQFRIASSADRLYATIRVQCDGGVVSRQEAAVHANPADLVKGQHARLLLSDGKQTYLFAVSFDGQRADSRDGNWEFDEREWTAHVGRKLDACTIVWDLPRKLVAAHECRINVVHADPAREIESCLSPTFDAGSDPDRVPDFRFSDRSVNRFARLIIE